jgi:SM-20-related protein
MDMVDEAFLGAEPRLVQGVLSDTKWAVVDNFLSEDTIRTLRKEAVALRKEGCFQTSQSERNGIVYEKNNVEAMQLDGDEQYFIAPRLHEYVVQTARSLPGLLNNGEVDVDGSYAANKLAVCLGGGSSYDKHFDNGGGGDTRKLTALLYLNADWTPEMGGEFRLWADDGTGSGTEECVDVEPKGGRLLVFFADSLPHAVMPSQLVDAAVGGCNDGDGDNAGHRYALTVWLPAAGGVADISFDPEKEDMHWGVGRTAVTAATRRI